MDEATVKALQRLLVASTVYIKGVAGGGTGFYIAKDLILTAGHVAGQVGDAVQVTPIQKAPRNGTVTESVPPEHGDVALVKINDGDVSRSQSVVLLTDRSPQAGDFVAVGFPEANEPWREGEEPLAYESIRYEAHARNDAETGDLLKLVVESGKSIGGGMSGAALLSVELGAVVGIVQYRKVKSDPAAGGGAIPITEIKGLLPEVQEVVRRYPQETAEWQEVLGDDLRLLEPDSMPSNVVTVEIGGNARQWRFGRIDDDGAVASHHEFDIDALPVGDVIFGWLRHRHRWDEADYRLAGALLGNALLPAITTENAERVAGINLMFASESPLRDIPWELACERGSDDDGGGGDAPRDQVDPESEPDCLSTRAKFEFTRSVKALRDSPGKPPKKASVLCLGPSEALQQAEEVFEDVKKISHEIEWPPKLSKAYRSLEKRPDIVHYIGYALSAKEGPQLLFRGEPSEQGRWASLKNLAQSAARNGARLLIIQTLVAPEGEPWFLDHPVELESAVQGSVAAVLYTQFPVPREAVDDFNLFLYDNLDKGESIEAAVQNARANLRGTYRDSWVFAAFALVTNGQRGRQIIERTEEGLGQGDIEKHRTGERDDAGKPRVGPKEVPEEDDVWA